MDEKAAILKLKHYSIDENKSSVVVELYGERESVS